MNVLVMYDHQTRTLWSQFLGRGVEGELTGVDLEVLPVTQTTWDSWKDASPGYEGPRQAWPLSY